MINRCKIRYEQIINEIDVLERRAREIEALQGQRHEETFVKNIVEEYDDIVDKIYDLGDELRDITYELEVESARLDQATQNTISNAIGLGILGSIFFG